MLIKLLFLLILSINHLPLAAMSLAKLATRVQSCTPSMAQISALKKVQQQNPHNSFRPKAAAKSLKIDLPLILSRKFSTVKSNPLFHDITKTLDFNEKQRETLEETIKESLIIDLVLKIMDKNEDLVMKLIEDSNIVPPKIIEDIRISEQKGFTVITLLKLLRANNFRVHAEKYSYSGHKSGRIYFTDPYRSANSDDSEKNSFNFRSDPVFQTVTLGLHLTSKEHLEMVEQVTRDLLVSDLVRALMQPKGNSTIKIIEDAKFIPSKLIREIHVSEKKCFKVVSLIKLLEIAGYTLYAERKPEFGKAIGSFRIRFVDPSNSEESPPEE